MVSSFLVICFESNAYRNIIKRVETARAVSFLCQGLSETCANACEGLSGGRKTNAFQKSAGCWKTRISSSWAPRPGKKTNNKTQNPNPTQKTPNILGSLWATRKGWAFAHSPNDLQGKISFRKSFLPGKSPLPSPSSGFPLLLPGRVGLGSSLPPRGTKRGAAGRRWRGASHALSSAQGCFQP